MYLLMFFQFRRATILKPWQNYRRPNVNELTHGGIVYTDTVDDGYDYSNNYFAKRAAYEDRPERSN